MKPRILRLVEVVFAPVWVPLGLALIVLAVIVLIVSSPFYYIWTGQSIFDSKWNPWK